MNYDNVPVTDYYGEFCFSDAIMKERLPKETFKEMLKIKKGECQLSRETADIIANTMKDWAIEKGATHYSHWFQPLTGLTAEKHDSFISPVADGTVIMEFSGKELIQGEPDASSFPNGGLRATFEARGYTAWDTTSPAFLKQDKTGLTLTIPTAFVSYTGEALDKKTPLLRSMQAINKSAVRFLRSLGNTTATQVISSVGPEQEYFLVEKELHDLRPDLRLCGRTVFGSMSAKGQEKDDHYFGAIKESVAGYMRELNQELWKLGISAKTQHNEVAPNQFELATIYDTSNASTDRNQIVMELMKKVADHHGMVCLQHEKPFAGVNGSGKHNNWSIGTDDGQNLLEPGDTPQDNAQFLLILAAVIKAVDKYSAVLRGSAANSGNDHRLGANEAPPAIISIFLGEQLETLLTALAEGRELENQSGEKVEVGVTTIPKFPKDMTDRNRTSPFAFTGNKFEFRMVGSSQSLAGPNVVLNTAVAEILDEFSAVLEKSDDINASIKNLVRDTYNAHKRIIFNGNGYSKEWEKEAEKLGLPNLKAAVYCIPEFEKDYSVELFEKHKVFSKAELESRVDIYMDNYVMDINIEAGLMVEMANRYILPVAVDNITALSESVVSLKNAGIKADVSTQVELIQKISENLAGMRKGTLLLSKKLLDAQDIEDVSKQAIVFRESVFVQMAEVRKFGDELERLCDKTTWPFPSYEDMLFRL